MMALLDSMYSILRPLTLDTVTPLLPSRRSSTAADPASNPKLMSYADEFPARTRWPG